MRISSAQVATLNEVIGYELYKVAEQDREDIKQDTLLKLCIAVSKQEVLNLSAFARIIARRTVVDYYRKKGTLINKNSFSVNFSDAVSADFTDAAIKNTTAAADTFYASSKEHGFELAELKMDYTKNRSKFSPSEKKALDVLLYSDEGLGMRPTELGEVAGVHKSHVSRALSKLREICR